MGNTNIHTSGLNDTPSANRIHIAFFGRTNAGKSSLVNAVTGQNLALVSDTKGTTTDPVYKAMELLPLGPVLIIDTPGIDDESALGEMRMGRTKQVLNKTDVAVLVLSGEYPPKGAPFAEEKELAGILKAKNIPYIVVQNKCDLPDAEIKNIASMNFCGEVLKNVLPVSAKTGRNIDLLKEKIAALYQSAFPAEKEKPSLVAGLVHPGDFALLVTPIDKAAPKGRLILPQQQTIRDILDTDACAIVVKESGLRETLASLGKEPSIVITDSIVFAEVSNEVPLHIPLTSFSILFARNKGFLQAAVNGIKTLETIQNADKILICEGCTHHRQCDDIGKVKLPNLIKGYTGKEPDFSFSSGRDFPEDLHGYKLIIHCGACMLNDREMEFRRLSAQRQGIPFTNYGISIACVRGILSRSIAMFNFNDSAIT